MNSPRIVKELNQGSTTTKDNGPRLRMDQSDTNEEEVMRVAKVGEVPGSTTLCSPGSQMRGCESRDMVCQATGVGHTFRFP